MYFIYCHTNKINGKKYIGVTSRTTKRRWQSGYDKTRFGEAIKKYGWSNFEHTVITTVETKEQAFELEKSLIHDYKANDPNYGYNVSHGGKDCDVIGNLKGEAHPNHKRIKQIDPETHEVIAIYATQTEAAEKTGLLRRCISKVCRGLAIQHGGYIWEYADEKYEKPIHNGRGNYDHKKSRKRIIVTGADGTKQEFESKQDACNALNVPQNSAWRYLKNGKLDPQKRGWAYA